MNIVANLITSNKRVYEPEDRTNTINPKAEINKTRIKKDIESFDSSLIQIIAYLKEIHKLKNQNGEFTLNYLVELFDRDIPEYSKSGLINKIHAIGFDKLRETFERINMECEDYFCESEDLFGIFKRHQFNKKLMRTESDKLRQVIQYIHVTLIHVNILHKKGISSPTNLICTKKVALKSIEPFVKEVEVLLQNILNQHKVKRPSQFIGSFR